MLVAGVGVVRGSVRLPRNNYSALMHAVANVGPVAISVAATEWQMYEKGLFDFAGCGADIDHAVLLAGYGTQTTKHPRQEPHGDYWLVRNSWGANWGESGYIRVRRYGAKGGEPCYTDKSPHDGDACAGDPSTMKVCGLCGLLADSSYPIILGNHSASQ